jgi:hypothetical protein
MTVERRGYVGKPVAPPHTSRKTGLRARQQPQVGISEETLRSGHSLLLSSSTAAKPWGGAQRGPSPSRHHPRPAASLVYFPLSEA